MFLCDWCSINPKKSDLLTCSVCWRSRNVTIPAAGAGSRHKEQDWVKQKLHWSGALAKGKQGPLPTDSSQLTLSCGSQMSCKHHNKSILSIGHNQQNPWKENQIVSNNTAKKSSVAKMNHTMAQWEKHIERSAKLFNRQSESLSALMNKRDLEIEVKWQVKLHWVSIF